MTKLYKSKKDDELYYYFLKNKNKRWMYRHKYYDNFGKRKEKKKSGFKTEKECLKALLEIKSALLNGQQLQVENSELTISQWLDIWYETYNNNWKITSRTQRKIAIRDQMKPLLGKYKLNQLDRTTYIRKYINVLLKTYEPSTVTLLHQLFRTAINAAVEDELLPRNRFNKVPIDNDKTLKNFLTPEELNIFLGAMKKQNNITNYTFSLLLAYTGFRRGEAMGLKWGNVDFVKKTVTVDCTRDNYGTRTPKTKNSYRTVPIDDILINQLLVYQKWCIETKFSYGSKLDKENDFVFISYQNGKPIAENTPFYSFKRVFEQLKNDDIHINEITPHGLRHTHATILINKGIPPKTIADRLGNTPEMIYKVYSHSFKEFEDKAVQAFGDTLAGAKIGAK